MESDRHESRYPDDLVLPFIFVAHGEPEPPELAEFKARYPGWFTIPADFIPYAHPPMAEPEPAGVNRFETTLPDSRPVPPSPQRDGRTDWDGAARAFRESDEALNDPAALLRASPVTQDMFGFRPNTGPSDLTADGRDRPAEASNRTPGNPDAQQLAALKCEGTGEGGCQSGGSWGMSGMYDVEGRTLCAQCTEKNLGITDLPGSERILIMRPFLLRSP